MSDQAPLIFRKVLGGLRPVGPIAEAAIRALDDGPVRVRITRTAGNVRRNALYWSCLGIAAPMLSERIEGDAIDAEMLHRILKDRRGLVRVITLPSGDTIKDYDSTSFAKMAEPERAAFVDWALATLSKWLGVQVEDLLREGQAA
ncbi:hypothetical protein [Sphingomonas sp. MA1305]|uniref:hypothetical protein n=1 Tax=Sphingomonas sp. MA1305 TaxID=2479204 RepID=UPI0018E03C25|nr:hypothetical protein [Sphingomonas sp. MA1305]